MNKVDEVGLVFFTIIVFLRLLFFFFFSYVTCGNFVRAPRVALLAPQFSRRDSGLYSLADFLARTNIPRARGLQHNIYTPVAAFLSVTPSNSSEQLPGNNIYHVSCSRYLEQSAIHLE